METSTKTMAGFAKYEILQSGKVRNIKNNCFIAVDKGGRTIRLIDDAGNRKSVKVQDLHDLFKCKESLVASASEKKPKKETKLASDALSVKKGKEVKQKKEKPSKEKKGGKLTMKQAEEIRRKYSAGGITQASIAKQYDVHASTISDIIRFIFKKS